MSTYKGFSQVELRRPQRSYFDLSHENRLSTRMGKLTPILITETMPNDTFNCQSEVFIRFAPMLAPIYHRVHMYVHYFFVPNRLLWDEWEDFITNGRLGTETPPVPPNAQIAEILSIGNELLNLGSLADYLDIPPIPDADVASWGASRKIDMMPFAAYYKCWYDYYRDRNYVPDNEYLPMASGELDPLNPDLAELVTIRYRAWQHDYFTSALPWTQRGSEVLMPLEGTGDVTYLPTSEVWRQGGSAADPQKPIYTSNEATRHTATLDSGVYSNVRIENIDEVTISNSSVSINDLRRAVKLQEWLERNALAGSRYNESIMAHFGRKTSDSRLQRAEYLGGGKVVVQISDVDTTSYSQDADSNFVPPGNPTGKGTGYGNTNSFKYNCEEHGFIVGILSVLPTSSYMQGLHKMFTRRNTFLDYPWPTFAHLGEQEVYKSELYMSPTNVPADRNAAPVFGYQSRYAEWKFKPSTSHGDFRTSLDYWHLTRKFSSSPVLGEEFVTFEDELQDRIFAVSGVDTMWCYIYINMGAKRSLPYFGTPML